MDRTRFSLIVALLVAFAFGAGFMTGRHYERKHGEYFNMQINEQGLIIEGWQGGQKERVEIR